jgi:glutamate-1-semialdehyde 2,1-aminomutase
MANKVKPSTQKSESLAAEIEKYIPGGVDSPFRSFHEVGGHTIFFAKGEGSRLYDVDGNIYIDYLGSWGPAILGHCHPLIVQAVQEAVAQGALFGAPHQLELTFAKMIVELIPSIEKVRFVNSGTEAVMSAVRLARGFTGRDTLVMFEGCYHGHSDSVLASQSHSSSLGVPKSTAGNTILLPYNDIAAVEKYLAQHAGTTAAVLIEPVAGSMGVIPPRQGYLNKLSDLCRRYEVLLIFDEVLTGLRVGPGGAQVLYGVKPDITCLGKALAGGMPIGAYGARAEIMDCLEPIGKVYQAGTFSGNPTTMAGGIATLKLLAQPGIYETLEQRTAQLFEGLAAASKKSGVSLQLQRVGSMFAILFAPHPVTNLKDSLAIDARAFARFFHHLLANGVYLPPSSVDAACVSAAHSPKDIDESIEVCAQALKAL